LKIRGYKTVQTFNSVGVPTYIKLKPMGLAWVCKPMPMKELVCRNLYHHEVFLRVDQLSGRLHISNVG